MTTQQKRIFIMMALVGGLMIFLAAGINAQEKKAAPGIPDVIEMNNTQAFQKHTKAIVQFTHGKHTAPKPEGHAVACGECHHDDKGQPLKDLKAGDPVKHCFECHNKTEKPKKSPDMSEEEWKKLKIQYYHTAIHENCVGCHKEQGGPAKCSECHPQAAK